MGAITTTIILAITTIAIIIITAKIKIVVMGVLIRMPTPMPMLGEDRWAGEDRWQLQICRLFTSMRLRREGPTFMTQSPRKPSGKDPKMESSSLDSI